jgi:hypothetical protein
MTIIWINPFCKIIMVYEDFQWNLAQECWTVILISRCMGCPGLIETPKYTEIHTDIQLYYIKPLYMMIDKDDSGYFFKKHYATADPGLCCLPLDLDYAQV